MGERTKLKRERGGENELRYLMHVELRGREHTGIWQQRGRKKRKSLHEMRKGRAYMR